jgi:hypothetical protein
VVLVDHLRLEKKIPRIEMNHNEIIKHSQNTKTVKFAPVLIFWISWKPSELGEFGVLEREIDHLPCWSWPLVRPSCTLQKVLKLLPTLGCTSR